MTTYTDNKGITRELEIVEVLPVCAYYAETTPFGDIWIGTDEKAYLV